MTNTSEFAREFVENGMLKSIKIIDCHAHMGAVYGTSLPLSSADEMIGVMDRENIEMIFCSPHSALFDPLAGNAELEAAMEKYPGRISGYYLYNPNYEEDFLPFIGRVLQVRGYIGFKLLPDYHHCSLSGPEYRDVLEFADMHGLTVLCHTWGGTSFNSAKQVEEVLSVYRNLTFIMGHSAPGETDEAIRLARTYDNAFLDLCDIHRHSGIVEKMVRQAGADKVLFGTDIPWYDPNYCLGSILFSCISDEEKYKIIYENARKIAMRCLEGEGDHGRSN